MVPTLQTIMKFSYYCEYRENMHRGFELTAARNADGDEGVFGNAGRVWVTTLRSNSP